MIEIYCDGACVPNPGEMGIGVVLRHKKRQKEISRRVGKGTNQVAELTAIGVALQQLKNKKIPITIYSDSLYALNSIKGKWNGKKNLDLINSIKSLLGMFDDITLIWVKGHAGNKYNERADYLAGKDLPKWRYI